MFKAFVLVRNLKSSADSLDFGEFRINRVRGRFKELREAFSSLDVDPQDWILEKLCAQIIVGQIPQEIEDVLLLLRLYKPGDISFVRVTIIQPNGEPLAQSPNRAINDLNSDSRELQFEIETGECERWTPFAEGIRGSQSWNSDWFVIARRFFLSGGAKRYVPELDEVEPIVDYATALEATLVPEKDYNTRRVRYRAAALLALSPTETEMILKLVNRLYDIRSRIVHGSRMSENDRTWLIGNIGQLELRVREVLRTAVRQLPPGEGDRRSALAKLYDPTDDDRGKSAVEKFKEIRTASVRQATAVEIARLA